MSGIFVSYRRASSAAVVYRLVDELKERFGDEAIFFDVESIEAGVSFSQAIQQALSKCTIAIIVIGPQWVHVTDDAGNRRLENPDDWVRHEVSAALNSRARVIPVLVEGADIPPHSLLPPNIQELANLQAFTFAKSPEYWDFDIKRLEERFRKIDKNLPRLGKHPEPLKPEPQATGSFSKKVIWGYALTVVFAFGFADPEPDASGLYGLAMFFAVAFGLHGFGLADINKGLTRGKGAAIGGMVLSLLFGLAAIETGVELESNIYPDAGNGESYSLDTEPQPPTTDYPDEPRGLAGVEKPPFTPQQADDIDYYEGGGEPDITGDWSSNIGASYQFGNNLNGTVFFYEFNAAQLQVGFGEGDFVDGEFTFEYTNTLLQSSAIVKLQMAAANGNMLRGTLYNPVTGQAVTSFELYRLAAGAGL